MVRKRTLKYSCTCAAFSCKRGLNVVPFTCHIVLVMYRCTYMYLNVLTINAYCDIHGLECMQIGQCVGRG